uniref:HAUS augmin-like complex, subunit 3 n=1 Tax=Cyprinus carpio TaxID=7962 RepID=A0A8C1SBN8_CYPCA
MLDGAQFVEALSRLGYPRASVLKGSEFDWLFDTAPDNLHHVSSATDANSALAAENAYTNSAVENLSKETTKLAGFFQTDPHYLRSKDGAAPPLVTQPVLLSQLSLDPFLQQQEQFTKVLTAYTQRQFFQGISNMMETSTSNRCQLTSLSCCSEHEEEEDEGLVELRKKEMAQLQWAYIVAQYQLVKERAKEHGEKASLCYSKVSRLESDLHSEILSIQSETQSLMLDPVRSALRDCACLLNIPVVRGDLALQLARQNYCTSRQTEVRDQLLRQKAFFEVVHLAQDAELLMGKRVMKQLEEILKRLEGAAEAAAQRENILTQPNLTQVISSKDTAFSKTPTERENPFQTYGRLETAAFKLQQDLVTVQEALDGARREQAYTGARLESDRDVLRHCAASSEVAGIQLNQFYLSDVLVHLCTCVHRK